MRLIWGLARGEFKPSLYRVPEDRRIPNHLLAKGKDRLVQVLKVSDVFSMEDTVAATLEQFYGKAIGEVVGSYVYTEDLWESKHS